MRLARVLAIAGAFAAAASALAADDAPRVLSIPEALGLAERAAPSLAAARAQEEQAHQGERAASAGYYPTLDAAAVDSSGFPGSVTGLDGFSGLVASPYRKGAGVDAFARWDLIDLSTWHGVEAARYQRQAAAEDTRLEMASVDQRALAAYLQAVSDRGDRDAWLDLVKELSGVAETVRTFVRTGQYAEVQQILIQDQLQEAQVRAAAYASRYSADLALLGYFTGLTATAIACPPPADLSGAEFDVSTSPTASPLVLAATLRAKAADEAYAKAGALSLPRLELAGSAGTLQDERLVGAQDYSVFAGVTMPLFEGFRLDAEQRRAGAVRNQEWADLAQARLAEADLTARYGERAEEAAAELASLEPELGEAGKAVDQARQRYLAFLGPLSDLQQALKDHVGIMTRLAEAKSALLLAKGSLRFLYGVGADGLH